MLICKTLDQRVVNGEMLKVMNVIIQTMQSFQTQKEGGGGVGCWGEKYWGETLVDTRYMIVYSQENHTKIQFQLCLSFL